MRAWTPVAAAVFLWLQSTSAFAQAKPASGDVGFIGIPQYTSTETGIPFFFKPNADAVDHFYREIRDAIARCDRAAYDKSMNAGYAVSAGDSSRPQFDKDRANTNQAHSQVPPFPEPCNPPGRQGGDRFHPYSLALLGGGLVPSNNTGNVTGVDTFFGPGAFLIDNKQGGSSNTVPLLGVRARASTDQFLQRLQEHEYRGLQVFIESGFQTSFGAQSFMQTFSGVSATPQGFGSNTVKENFQIPILIGVGVPLVGGPTPVFLDGYGGVTISNSTQTLQGREAGAPGGGGFFASQTRTTVDPTVGVGLRVIFNNQSLGGAALPPIILGANAEVSFRPGGFVQAQSPNFPSESYYGTVDSRAMAAFMIRAGILFGGR